MTIPDTIHILGFTGNPDATFRTVKEVERAGFKAEPFWCFPNPFTDFLAASFTAFASRFVVQRQTGGELKDFSPTQ